jgi:hypothetical protein
MIPTPDLNGLFSSIIRNKVFPYRIWVSKAEFQLKLHTKNLFARYSTGEDIIMEIITGILCGRIHWDQVRVPNLHTFMHHQIRSHISNIVRNEKNKLTPSKINPDQKGFPVYVDADNIPSDSVNEFLTMMELVELQKRVLHKLQEDVIAYFVYEEIIAGSTNRFIAEKLKIPYSEVVNAKKRIIRVVKGLSGNNHF